MRSKRPRVSIARVREQNTYAALKEAFDRLGDLADLIPAGSSVLIKPNMVMGPTERGVTNNAVLEAVLAEGVAQFAPELASRHREQAITNV